MISTTISINEIPAIRALNKLGNCLRGFSNLGNVFSGVNNGLNLLSATAANAAEALSVPIAKAAEMESLGVSFDVLLGDARKAKTLMEDLTALGAATPFGVTELASSAKSLVAFGISSENVVETLRRLGDVSSGIGAPLNEIAQIYGKARVQGRLFAEDINQLTGRGIPVIQEFARQFGVTDEEVKQLVADGSIGFSNLEAAFKSLTGSGGKFEGMMARQSQTWEGLFSTMQDSVSQVQVLFGTGLVNALKPALESLIEYLGGMEKAAQKFGVAMGGVVSQFISFGQVALPVVGAMADIHSWVGRLAIGFIALKLAPAGAIGSLEKGVRSLAVSLRSPLASIGSFRVLWNASWASMATVTSVACVTMKAAIKGLGRSLLIGLALEAAMYAIGKIIAGVQYLIRLASRGRNLKGIQAGNAKTLAGYDEKISGVANDGERDALAQKIETEIETIRITDNPDDDPALREERKKLIPALQERLRMLKALPPSIMAANAAQKGQTASIEDTAKAASKLKDELARLQKQYDAYKQKGKSLDEQRTDILIGRTAGVIFPNPVTDPMTEEKFRKNVRDYRDNADTPAEIATLGRLIKAEKELDEINEKRAANAQKAEEANHEHAQKVAILNAEIAGNGELVNQLKAEERLRERIAELKNAGVKDAEAKARQESKLKGTKEDEEQRKTREEYFRQYAADMKRMDAEMRGDQPALDAMNRKALIAKYEKEARDAGVTNAKRARSLAEAKADAELASQGKDKLKSATYADSDRRVGLGGRAATVRADPMLKASQDATRATNTLTRALTTVAELLKKRPDTVVKPLIPVFN